MLFTIKEIEQPRQLSRSVIQLSKQITELRKILFENLGIPKERMIIVELDELQQKLRNFYY
jgi:precorrin-6B methylase 1